MTDLSVIIVCYKGWDKVVKCLESLNDFKGDKFKFEVIVVDNDSGDGRILEIQSQFPGFQYVRNKVNGGYSNGNNLGSRYAVGEYLLILNPDTIASESGIEKMLLAACANPGYSIISCRQVNKNGKETRVTGDFPGFFNLTGLQRSVLNLIRGRKGDRGSVADVVFPDWISGSVVLIRKDLFKKMEGFYEGFWMYYEDVDLCKRVTDNNGRIAFLRNIKIEHNHGGSSRIDIQTTSVTKSEVQVSKHLYISRNKKGPERLLIQIFLVVNNLITGVVLAVTGIIFFFVPKLFVRSIMFFRLVSYYAGAIRGRSWISPRSVMNRERFVKNY